MHSKFFPKNKISVALEGDTVDCLEAAAYSAKRRAQDEADAAEFAKMKDGFEEAMASTDNLMGMRQQVNAACESLHGIPASRLSHQDVIGMHQVLAGLPAHFAPEKARFAREGAEVLRPVQLRSFALEDAGSFLSNIGNAIKKAIQFVIDLIAGFLKTFLGIRNRDGSSVFGSASTTYTFKLQATTVIKPTQEYSAIALNGKLDEETMETVVKEANKLNDAMAFLMQRMVNMTGERNFNMERLSQTFPVSLKNNSRGIHLTPASDWPGRITAVIDADGNFDLDVPEKAEPKSYPAFEAVNNNANFWNQWVNNNKKDAERIVRVVKDVEKALMAIEKDTDNILHTTHASPDARSELAFRHFMKVCLGLTKAVVTVSAHANVKQGKAIAHIANQLQLAYNKKS